MKTFSVPFPFENAGDMELGKMLSHEKFRDEKVDKNHIGT